MVNTDRRVKGLARRLDSHGIDVLALLPGANFTYYTGLSKGLSERPTVAFFSPNRRPAFIVPSFELSSTKQLLSSDVEFFAYTDEQGYEGAFQRASDTLKLAGKQIGVEYQSMRLLELRQIERSVPDCVIKEADALLAESRMVKDDGELESMREAIRITEAALRLTIDQVRPGQTELEVQNILHAEMLRAGAHGLGFDPLILSGPRAALPHATAEGRAIQSGDCLIFDFGAKYESYTADITRTFSIGTENPEWKEIYEVVKEANAAARRLAGPNVKAQDVDRAAREVIEKAGYGEYFTHRTGHGLGLEVHEPPYIVAGNETLLQPRMTFTIEPGIYISGRYGVRIEDDVVITEDGCESLATFPRELMVI